MVTLNYGNTYHTTTLTDRCGPHVWSHCSRAPLPLILCCQGTSEAITGFRYQELAPGISQWIPGPLHQSKPGHFEGVFDHRHCRTGSWRTFRRQLLRGGSSETGHTIEGQRAVVKRHQSGRQSQNLYWGQSQHWPILRRHSSIQWILSGCLPCHEDFNRHRIKGTQNSHHLAWFKTMGLFWNRADLSFSYSWKK